MGHHAHRHALTRRHFLQTLGAVTGASLLPAFSPFPRTARAASLPGRPGLILPESAAGESFLTGYRLALPQQRPTVVRVEPGRVSVSQGAERLLAAGSDTLIGLMGPNLAAAVAPHLEASGAKLLAVDTGANVMRTDEENPQVVTHSLGLWRSALAMGAWSARQYGPRGLVLSGIVESGYDMLHAFEIGLTGEGGSPLPAIVTHVPPDPVDWAAVLNQVREARPDVVYALYSGAEAVEFLRAWRKSGLRVPLAASPFLVDEALLPLHDGRAEGVPSVSAWAPGLSTPANQAFVAGYTAATGSAPDAFALLGYEAGLLAARNTQAADGPRGWIRPGPVGATRSPLYLRKVAGLANQVAGALPAPAENDPAVAELRSAVRTGWTAPYLV